jgi:DNA-binding LytR/AlgR family response regulator
MSNMLIKAFETFSIDYLLKPIKEERLAQSIEK